MQILQFWSRQQDFGWAMNKTALRARRFLSHTPRRQQFCSGRGWRTRGHAPEKDALPSWMFPKHLEKLFSLRKHPKARGNSVLLLPQLFSLRGLISFFPGQKTTSLGTCCLNFPSKPMQELQQVLHRVTTFHSIKHPFHALKDPL